MTDRRWDRARQDWIYPLTDLEKELLEALKEARDALRNVAVARRAIGPIATYAQQAAWAASATIERTEAGR